MFLLKQLSTKHGLWQGLVGDNYVGFGQRDNFVNALNAAPEGGTLGPTLPPWVQDMARRLRDARHEWYRTDW